MSRVRCSLVVVAAGALLACSGERWVVGEAQLDAGAADALGSDAAASNPCAATAPEGIASVSSAPALAAPPLGRWRATLSGPEVDAFPAGTVELQLTSDSPSLRFEDGSVLPPVQDPSAGYLCGSAAESCASTAGFVAGFDYRLAEPRTRGSILSFALFPDEPWHEWCARQLPVEIVEPGCGPRYDVEAPYAEALRADGCAVRRGDVWTDIACDRLSTVERQVCACTAESCSARARRQPVNLRLVDPSSLEGALWFTADRAQVLLFRRAE